MCIELKGVDDIEIFQKNLGRELTEEEIREIRKWAGLPAKKLTNYFIKEEE